MQFTFWKWPGALFISGMDNLLLLLLQSFAKKYTINCKDGIPIADLTKKTGIQYRMIKEWLSRYARDGYAGLTTRKRGRPKRIEPTSDAERIRQLEMENEVLRTFQEEYERWNAKK